MTEQQQQAYLKFLMQVLKATDKSEGNPQVVYPLLKENIKYLSRDFAEFLRRWATNLLTRVQKDEAQYRALVISDFSDLIREFPLGDKASNLEIAIAGYEAVLTVFTHDTSPRNWAVTQIGLGIALCHRIPKDQDKAQNLEDAIAAFTLALKVFTRNASPIEWANTQINLGTAYFYRIDGDKKQNLEDAIAAFTLALKIFTRNAHPQKWAETQINLGSAYLYRQIGDKAQNIEDAITAFTLALEVFTYDTSPIDWAKALMNLGIAYSDRIRDRKEENLELAIAALTDALKVFTHNPFSEDWAKTQMNLGKAYLHTTRNKPQNLELAIEAFTAALQVFTREAFYQEWAMAQNNLGNAYFHRKCGNKAENIELAIGALTAASEVRTRDKFPQQWAMTQNNLGNAYANRICGDKAENFKQAIAAYTPALEVYTREAFPEDHARTLFNLGHVYLDAQQFTSAHENLKSAIEIVEFLREEIVSGDETKRKQAEQWNPLYHCMIKTCLELGNIAEAIEYIERSKTRTLVELIFERDLKTIFPSEDATTLEQLRVEIASGQNQLQNRTAENPEVLVQRLQKLRQQRNDLQNQYLSVGYDFDLGKFQKTLDEDTAIVEWYITTTSDTAFETFIITQNSLQRLEISNEANVRKAFLNWFKEYLKGYSEAKNNWKNSLPSFLCRLAEILHVEHILKLVPENCSRLILIPHTGLHLVPLHALPLANGDFLCDRFSKNVSYAPSCQLLQQLQPLQNLEFQRLFAVQTPTEDLYEKDLGAIAAIKEQFNNAYILKKAKATKSKICGNEELLKANCAFFFCHGYFNFYSPLDSGLLLADCFVSPELARENPKQYILISQDKAVDLSKCLTLVDIITHLKLEKCRLVTLSACETGLTDLNSVSDEYIGLPYGFLLAGSTNVVSSLWNVSADATALLMIKFFEELEHQSNIAIALNTAQHWLRNTSLQEFRAWLKKSNLNDAWQSELDEGFRQREQQEGATTKIFESPYYWSAFCAIGKGV
ncbi:hypothetical protein A6S26_23070 [Nostoc sp. ATCC 43529]|nr:hypothetical protein A6S26_23070 [Nostoc sp. ATCC 43529]